MATPAYRSGLPKNGSLTPWPWLELAVKSPRDHPPIRTPKAFVSPWGQEEEASAPLRQVGRRHGGRSRQVPDLARRLAGGGCAAKAQRLVPCAA